MLSYREKSGLNESFLNKVFDVLQSRNREPKRYIENLIKRKKQLTKEQIKLTLNEKTPYVET